MKQMILEFVRFIGLIIYWEQLYNLFDQYINFQLLMLGGVLGSAYIRDHLGLISEISPPPTTQYLLLQSCYELTSVLGALE